MVEELSVKADQAVQAIEALRSALLALLVARGLAVSDEVRDRVAMCNDPAILQRWLLRAMSAGSVEEAYLYRGLQW